MYLRPKQVHPYNNKVYGIHCDCEMGFTKYYSTTCAVCPFVYVPIIQLFSFLLLCVSDEVYVVLFAFFCIRGNVSQKARVLFKCVFLV